MKHLFKHETIDQAPDILEFLKQTYPTAEACHVYLPKTCEVVPERFQKTYRPTPGERVLGIIIKHEQMSHKNFAGHTPPLAALHMMFELAMLSPFKEFNVGLNWPDDAVIKHKTIATLFTESIIENSKVVGILAIITMHLNNTYSYSNEYYHTNISATTLSGKEIDEEIYINTFLNELETLYALWESKQYPQLYSLWREQQVYLNDTITLYHNIGMVMRGQVLDFLANGDMVLHDENGKNHTIHYLQVQETTVKK